MRLLLPRSRERTPWAVRLAALALAAAGPVAMSMSAGGAARARVPDERGRAAERVVALVPPWRPDAPAAPAGEVETPVRPAAPGAPSAGTQPRAMPAPAASPIAILPPFPQAADSSGSAAPARPGDAAPRIAAPRIAAPREVFGGAAVRPPLCLPPACGGGPVVSAGSGGRAAAGVGARPMTRAERDSVARAVVAAAARRGGASGGGGSLPPGAAGVSIAVGLPGGGPSAAQRARARALDADVTARLARIQARADSLRRDSLEALARGTR